MCICINESLCCIPETNTTLSINYSNRKQNRRTKSKVCSSTTYSETFAFSSGDLLPRLVEMFVRSYMVVYFFGLVFFFFFPELKLCKKFSIFSHVWKGPFKPVVFLAIWKLLSVLSLQFYWSSWFIMLC